MKRDFFLLLRSIRWRIALMIVLGLALIAAVVLFNSYKSREAVNEQNLRDGITQTSKLLNLAIAPISSTSELSQLSEFINAMLSSKERPKIGITYIVIFDADGKRLLEAVFSLNGYLNQIKVLMQSLMAMKFMCDNAYCWKIAKSVFYNMVLPRQD